MAGPRLGGRHAGHVSWGGSWLAGRWRARQIQKFRVRIASRKGNEAEMDALVDGSASWAVNWGVDCCETRRRRHFLPSDALRRRTPTEIAAADVDLSRTIGVGIAFWFLPVSCHWYRRPRLDSTDWLALYRSGWARPPKWLLSLPAQFSTSDNIQYFRLEKQKFGQFFNRETGKFSSGEPKISILTWKPRILTIFLTRKPKCWPEKPKFWPRNSNVDLKTPNLTNF